MLLPVRHRLVPVAGLISLSLLQSVAYTAAPASLELPTRVVALPAKEGPLRIWTRSDGSRSKAARFLKYDALSGLAHFERQDGRSATTILSTLCDADRLFIAAELGDAPLQYSGPGITPPPGSPMTVNRAGKLLQADGTADLPLVLASGARRGFGKGLRRSREAPTTAVARAEQGPRLVTLKTGKQPFGEGEPIPTPNNIDPQLMGDGSAGSYVSPRVVFYGCRGTWHLIDGMGTASYQLLGQWWLTALKKSTSPAGYWYYQEAPTLNNTGRFWAFKLWKTPCGHVCGHGCGCCHHHHHYGFEVWLWRSGQWHLHDCAHFVRMRPFGYAEEPAGP